MKNYIKVTIALTVLLLFSNANFAQIYLDPNAPIDERVSDLLSRMTIDEKIGQMTQADHAAINDMNDMKKYFIGSVLSGGGSDPSSGNNATDWVNLYDAFQTKALETRLKIPVIYGIDAVHGHSNVTGAVIFPHNIGLGATRNPELIEETARITAIEIAATGIDWTFAPCVAVPRDERWGRTYEGFGETPELARLLGSAAVRGYQTETLNGPTSIAACAKHFIGDGGTTRGDDQGNTEISEEELRAIHLPGYIAAIENDVKTIMATYNSWNGEKVHGHKYLLNDLLKEELGFKGFVVSDWAAIDQLPGDYISDIEQSINAGIDMVMVPNNYVEFISSLKNLVAQEKVSVNRIDDAVERILKVKFELGLFENPLADRSLLSLVGSDEHRAVARQSVRESQVILKKNDGILPIPKENVKILVAGEFADNIGLQCGGWTIQWQGASGEITEGTTLLEGLVKYAPSAEIIYEADGNFNNYDADYAIVVIGEKPYAEGEGDREDLSISNSQISLIRKIKKMGLPVITILISGRPMIINPGLHNSDIFIASWLPGTEADGIAEILFGEFNPTGVLPMSWPSSMEQIPINIGDDYYNPLFEYGFGITSLNNSPVGSAPKFYSALLTEEGGSIEIAFNKVMNNPSNASAIFNVQIANSESVTVTQIGISPHDENVLLLELNKTIEKNENITISYLEGNLSSVDGGLVQPFSDETVINIGNFVVGRHDLPGKVEAENYSSMAGVETENTSDAGGGLNVGWIDDGDWLEYECNVESSGMYLINLRVASQSGGGVIKFSVDDNEEFTKSVTATNGWQNWETISQFANLYRGKSTIRIFADKGGFNLNWFEAVIFTDVEDETSSLNNFNLYQNYPNPFNPSTTIRYSINSFDNVSLKIFDILGNEVAVLVNEPKAAGNYSVTLNAANLSSGVYFYKLESGYKSETKKLLLLK